MEKLSDEDVLKILSEASRKYEEYLKLTGEPIPLLLGEEEARELKRTWDHPLTLIFK